MEIELTTEKDKATFAVSGTLTVQTAPDLEDAIRALDPSFRNIDLDLSGAEYVSSAGLRVFVATSKLAAHRGGMFRLVKPVDDVMEVLEMTGLNEVLEVVR